MTNFNFEQFKKFRAESSKAGYENEKAQEIKESDGSITLSYESGDWKFQDNYFGGEPYGGRTIYHYKGKPVHITVYYGWLNETEYPDMIYKFLRKALRAENRLEFRGPASFTENQLLYTNSLKGSIENFLLEEKIFKEGKEIYKAYFIGGLVDQRRGD